jgi:cation:H+ antiporter
VLLTLLGFAASLAVLLAAARRFTSSAERIGLALGMSPFAIGVLIVSAGTSLRELVSSIVAVAPERRRSSSATSSAPTCPTCCS